METDFILSLARAATASTAVEPEPELEPVQYRISGSAAVVVHVDKRQFLGGVVWQAALALSRALLHRDAPLIPGGLRGRRVLELGCGPGLCGLCAWVGGAELVLMTDMGHCKQLVEKNIGATATRSPGATSGAVSFLELKWGANHLPSGCLAHSFDTVIGSDLT